MNQVSREQNPAEVRSRIEEAGNAAEGIRILLGRGGWCVLVSLAVVSGGTLFLADVWAHLTLLVTCLAMVSSLVARPVAAGYREVRRARLRQELAALPRHQLVEVLTPLQYAACPDTRKIVAPLLRELRAGGTEVTPAGSPEGRGGEVAPS